MERKETIAAVATAMVNSGIGIIRISGQEALDVIDRIFFSPSGKKLSHEPSHRIYYGFIKDEERVIDEVMVLVMRAPNTYTREDTVEIDCHGGAFLMQEILKVVLKNGARAAEPGEFTKRAFLNGRIDLAQAESVMDLIHAENEYARKNSVKQLNGELSKKITDLRKGILYQLAYIESALDDPEHISLDGYRDTLKEFIEEMGRKLERLIKESEDGRILTNGISTVILGKPNAGKSSLLNLLAGEERAIVTEMAGTTRDVLTEHVMLGELSLHIADTAGIRDTQDMVEKIGIKKAKEYAEKADLLIYVADSLVPLDENDREIIELIRDRRAIVLLNKMDMDGVVDEEELRDLTGKTVICISAREKTGITELESAIKELFDNGGAGSQEEACITNIRQRQAVMDAYKSILLVKDSIENQMPEDFYTIDLMDAYEELGYVTGETLEDDLIDEIFEKFCMGK